MSFIVKNARFLGFGVAMAFLSSFGQTFFIGVYKDAITGEFALSNSDFGLYYLLITLVSAVGLNRLGHIIDRVSLTPYVAALIIAMAAACLAVGVAGSLWSLVIALMLVRLLGQGLLTHASMTCMSRYYGKNRGLSVAVAGLGFPLGQAVLPVAAVMLMSGFAWRTGWIISAALLLLVALPTVLWLLKGQLNRHKQWHLDEAAGRQDPLSPSTSHLRRKDVIADWRFYLMLPALIVGPFWITGVFFFPGEIAQFKGVETVELTAFYGFYALGSVAAPFMGGLLVDRYGGRHLMPLYPPLFGAALWLIIPAFGPMGIALFMGLLGLGAGITLPINNAIWAELYGTRYLGEIKSLSTSIVVVSTALSPFLIGLALESGYALMDVLLLGALSCLVAMFLVLPVALQGVRSPFSRK